MKIFQRNQCKSKSALDTIEDLKKAFSRGHEASVYYKMSLATHEPNGSSLKRLWDTDLNLNFQKEEWNMILKNVKNMSRELRTRLVHNLRSYIEYTGRPIDCIRQDWLIPQLAGNVRRIVEHLYMCYGRAQISKNIGCLFINMWRKLLVKIYPSVAGFIFLVIPQCWDTCLPFSRSGSKQQLWWGGSC